MLPNCHCKQLVVMYVPLPADPGWFHNPLYIYIGVYGLHKSYVCCAAVFWRLTGRGLWGSRSLTDPAYVGKPVVDRSCLWKRASLHICNLDAERLCVDSVLPWASAYACLCAYVAGTLVGTCRKAKVLTDPVMQTSTTLRLDLQNCLNLLVVWPWMCLLGFCLPPQARLCFWVECAFCCMCCRPHIFLGGWSLCGGTVGEQGFIHCLYSHMLLAGCVFLASYTACFWHMLLAGCVLAKQADKWQVRQRGVQRFLLRAWLFSGSGCASSPTCTSCLPILILVWRLKGFVAFAP